MCITESMIEFISISITAIATLCAAFSAQMSYQVSKNTLEFQKNYSKNQQLIGRLNINQGYLKQGVMRLLYEFRQNKLILIRIFLKRIGALLGIAQNQVD